MNFPYIYSVVEGFYSALMQDIQPTPAARVDFGLDGYGNTNPQEIYQAYQQAIRSGRVTREQLQEALGNGPALTELIGTQIHTVWDSLEADSQTNG
jgi:hypothetical protein